MRLYLLPTEIVATFRVILFSPLKLLHEFGAKKLYIAITFICTLVDLRTRF